MPKWIIDPEVKRSGMPGVFWLKDLLAKYDLHRLDWVRIDLGRGAKSGAYGRCWWPEARKKGFRISIQVPGPFPSIIVVRRGPVYILADGMRSRKLLPDERVGAYREDYKDGKVTRWNRIVAGTRIESMAEGIVWVGAHEAYHFLRRSRQIPGRQGEIEADAYADAKLAEFRANPAAQLHGIWAGLTKAEVAIMNEEHA